MVAIFGGEGEGGTTFRNVSYTYKKMFSDFNFFPAKTLEMSAHRLPNVYVGHLRVYVDR